MVFYSIAKLLIQKRTVKMKMKFYATDLDGTLISEDGSVSRKNIDAMKKAVEDGFFVAPTTGRSYYEMPEVLREEKPFTHCICSNGAVIFDGNINVLWESTFPEDVTDKIISVLSEYDTMIEVYADGTPTAEQKYLNKEAYEHFRIEENYHAVMDETRKGVDDISKFLKESGLRVEIFNVFFHDADEREEAFERLRKMDIAELTTSMQSNMELLQKGVNKGTALTRLMDIIGVTKEETAAAGDSQNDLSMFSAVGKKLAVSNACDELKAIATDIICSNDEGSADYALSHYFY